MDEGDEKDSMYFFYILKCNLEKNE